MCRQTMQSKNASSLCPLVDPVYADPVYADRVYSDPVYADRVYSDPVYADHVIPREVAESLLFFWILRLARRMTESPMMLHFQKGLQIKS